MKLKIQKILAVSSLLLIVVFCLTASSCNDSGSSNGGEVFDAEAAADAIKLIQETNRNLHSIRVLHKENESKVDELKKALEKRDIEKVKKLADSLSLIINDGYLFAENAKEKIEKAQQLNINEDWKEYLRLKESSLEMQINAFDFRRQTAKLIRDKFGGKDKLAIAQLVGTFKKNEENFKKYMVEAGKFTKQADALAKEVSKQ